MKLETYRITTEPYYQAVADEVAIFEAAYSQRLPVMLKGPTGCGKTRFVEHMAWRLGKPLVTVAAHEDMTASDLAGRYLLEPQGTVWHDGRLTQAVRYGAICYLDEIVEARQDTTVVIHRTRRIFPLEKHNEIVAAHLISSSRSPTIRGHQSEWKDSQGITKQGFLAPSTSPIPRRRSRRRAEAGTDSVLASRLVAIGERSRNLQGHGLDEALSRTPISCRTPLVTAGFLEAAIRSASCCRSPIIPTSARPSMRRSRPAFRDGNRRGRTTIEFGAVSPAAKDQLQGLMISARSLEANF